MFGIPTDPRLIEVLGWLFYAVPVLVVFLWPARWASSPAARRRLLGWSAAGLAAVALALVVLVPAGGVGRPGRRRVAVESGDTAMTLGAPDGDSGR